MTAYLPILISRKIWLSSRKILEFPHCESSNFRTFYSLSSSFLLLTWHTPLLRPHKSFQDPELMITGLILWMHLVELFYLFNFLVKSSSTKLSTRLCLNKFSTRAFNSDVNFTKKSKNCSNSTVCKFQDFLPLRFYVKSLKSPKKL